MNVLVQRSTLVVVAALTSWLSGRCDRFRRMLTIPEVVIDTELTTLITERGERAALRGMTRFLRKWENDVVMGETGVLIDISRSRGDKAVSEVKVEGGISRPRPHFINGQTPTQLDT